MALWAGIDEAGYGPLLGPLVVAGTLFRLDRPPREGELWRLLQDAVCRQFKTADGRLVVDDSKRVYNRARGIRPLEEGVLGFLAARGQEPESAGQLLTSVAHPVADAGDCAAWFRGVAGLALPRRSNRPALASKAAVLRSALDRARVAFVGARASVVLPREFNDQVGRTGNKGHLLFQRCGMLLQAMWRAAAGEDLFVLVDRHGGRRHYRHLLADAFPGCACDIVEEAPQRSVYRIAGGGQTMVVGFKEGADSLALPVALASMTAKYIRELYMEAFNAYWTARVEGLKPTAGYVTDGRRFLKDIGRVLEDGRVDVRSLVRIR